ncbi:sigma-70 family RNA polymerase sigma factor [Bacillus sp. NP157]|nr:sigma-70 family RNA polymerase sigma factor [Bacillus sp. NP157]
MTGVAPRLVAVSGTVPTKIDSPCGDDRAFEAFARERRGHLVAFLRQRLVPEEDTQDIAQESFTRLMKYRSEPPETWSALLYRIASNAVTDRARHARSHRANDHVRVDDFADFLASADPEQGHFLDTVRALEDVQKALLRLPERCRDVYLLNRIEGMSYAEVAAHCGISVKAVEKHISRALALLRRYVDTRSAFFSFRP